MGGYVYSVQVLYQTLYAGPALKSGQTCWAMSDRAPEALGIENCCWLRLGLRQSGLTQRRLHLLFPALGELLQDDAAVWVMGSSVAQGLVCCCCWS